MYPKSRIKFEREHKEAHRRLKLIAGRLRAIPHERSFVQGRLKAFPKKFPLPPDWALGAARIASERILAPIAHLNPQGKKNYTREDLIELHGYGRMLFSYAVHPTEELAKFEDEMPEAAKMHAPVRKQAAKLYRKMFGVHRVHRVQRAKAKQEEIPTREQLKEWSRRAKKGIDAFEGPDGEPAALKTATTRIYYFIWLLWPELTHRFTASDIHAWLKSDLDETTSDKTVEAIVTRLRKEGRRTAQP